MQLQLIQITRRSLFGIAWLALALGMLAFAGTASADTHHYNINHTTYSDSATFKAHLSGSQEVPPVSSGVTGDTEIMSKKDGKNMEFKLSVYNGKEVTEAHLHCAPPGKNGPPVVTLYHNTNGVNIDGLLSSGTITDTHITHTTGCASLIGYDIKNVSDLARAIEEGKIYVNVHNKQYPNGAARGQLMGDDQKNDWNKDHSGYDSNKEWSDQHNTWSDQSHWDNNYTKSDSHYNKDDSNKWDDSKDGWGDNSDNWNKDDQNKDNQWSNKDDSNCDDSKDKWDDRSHNWNKDDHSWSNKNSYDNEWRN